ncbi:MAG: stalk domain-containing protein [Caldisericia bacterium]
MMRWSRFTVIVLVCGMVLAGMPRGVRAQTANNWGFETGTLAGWTVVQAANHVGVTGADGFTTPYWGSYMAILGQPGQTQTGGVDKKLAMPFSGSPLLEPRKQLGVLPTVISSGRNTIRREFTANMAHLVFAYNVFSYYGPDLVNFSYRVSLLDGSGVIASSPRAARDVGTGSRTMSLPQPSTTGWQIRDVDLSQYLYQQLVIEVSIEMTNHIFGSDRGMLVPNGNFPTWAYFDVNPDMPIVRADAMPEVRFVVPVAPGATVAGTSMDVVIEATDDQSIAEIRLLVNGVLAGQSMVPGRQTFHVSLQEGLNTLQAIAMDGSGKQAMVAMTVMADSHGPILALDTPVPEQTTNKLLVVSGNVQDPGSGVRSLMVNGDTAAADAAGAFSITVHLQPGTNEVVIEAVDNLGNTTTQAFMVTYRSPSSAPSSTYVVLTIGSADMEVNGLTRKLDAAPFIKDGRTLLPIRALIEALGGSVEWNATTKTATVALGSRTIALTIGSTTALVNGKSITLDVAPMIVKGRTFLPLRAVAENIGLDLAWEPISRTISLTYWP